MCGSAADTVASALDLWRGPALQGLPRTAAFSAEARRLEALHVDALEEHFEVMLALGEHRELGPALRSALADNPFRERLWGQLMLALYRSGRQADALETFQEARRVLAEELGLEPGPELRRLQEAILAHDPAIAGVPVERRRRGNLPATSTSFVGREEELAQVAAFVREHRLVTLIGPPGVGKSRLALETARSLEHEFPEGIWLVDFARAGGAADDAARLLASAIDVRGSDPHERVVAASSRLRARRPRRVRARTRRGDADRVGAPRRLSRGPDHGDEPRGASRRERGTDPRRAARLRSRGALPRACAHGAAGIQDRMPRLSRWRRRSSGGWTACRSRSSLPPRA